MTVQMWPLAGRGRLRTLCALTPGLVLPLTVAAAAFFAAGATGAPVMLFALVIGIALSTVSEEACFHAGLSFALWPVLQFGVALLGLNISVSLMASLVGHILLLVAVVSVVLIASGIALSRCYGLSRAFGVLAGGATGICGASAALA